MVDVMWGADPAQLTSWADRAGAEQTQLVARIDELERLMQRVRWHGADAEDFRDRWQALHALATGTAERLGTIAEGARQHADEQEEASRAGTDGGPAPAHGEDDGFIGGWKDGGAWPWQRTRDLRDDIPLEGPDVYGLDAMNQRGTPNCLVVATLGALSEQNPEFLREHIEQVGDETYEVTLYDENGDPVVYTVEGRIAKEGMVGADGEQNWMSLYEDALIQHGTLAEGDQSLFGGEDDVMPGGYVRGHRPHDLSSTITGVQGEQYTLEGSERMRVEEIHNNDIARQIEDGGTVVLGTHNLNADAGGVDVVEQHAYVVESVNDDGTVTVVNPWGADAGYGDGDGSHRIDIPINALHHHFEDAWVMPPNEDWEAAA